MADALPKYDDPPVVETVIGLQFAPLSGFSTAHAGLFWRDRLGSDWVKASDAPRLEDTFERFGGDLKWGPVGGMLVRTSPVPERIQLIDKEDERMIQIQDTRFIYNWRRRDRSYPSYDHLSPQFRRHFEDLRAFAPANGLGEVSVNQWEVTYVNHIRQGDLWESPTDWPAVIPGLYFPPAIPTAGIQPEDVGGDWRFTIGDQRGRLHVNLRHARMAADGPELMVLNLVARGPVDVAKGMTWESGLDLGHRAIVTTFAAMTSEQAHERWRRKR